jgi:hypothetical protein
MAWELEHTPNILTPLQSLQQVMVVDGTLSRLLRISLLLQAKCGPPQIGYVHRTGAEPAQVIC